ncbi:MAG: hypothetical protein ACOCXT_00960 [Candidatus Dojkabacteria bacterium]
MDSKLQKDTPFQGGQQDIASPDSSSIRLPDEMQVHLWITSCYGMVFVKSYGNDSRDTLQIDDLTYVSKSLPEAINNVQARSGLASINKTPQCIYEYSVPQPDKEYKRIGYMLELKINYQEMHELQVHLDGAFINYWDLNSVSSKIDITEFNEGFYSLLDYLETRFR